MKWRKLGQIFQPIVVGEWQTTHAAVPVAAPLGGDRYRVYYSARDRAGRSHTGFFELDLQTPGRSLAIARQPVLAPGAPGSFDEDGAMATWLVDVGGDRRLYYIGWNRGHRVPFRNALGLAVAPAGEKRFEKLPGPILDRSIHDPCFTASACVLVEDGLWRAWYLSAVAWQMRGGAFQPRYHIKYAESDDGIDWRREGRVAIDFRDDGETAISRPSVVHDGDLYRMWYSYRGERYRIGYAESPDGLVWERRDAEAGIDVSLSGWDSEMIEYPCVFDHRGERYLLYNGNGYGATGIGLAVLVES